MRTNKFESAILMLSELTLWSDFENKLYLVGGCVRDEILGLPIKDLDILVNMPNGAQKLANYLCDCWPEFYKDFVVYERFGTAKVTCVVNKTDIVELEFVEPRTEIYDPTSRKPIKCEFTTLETDALRRDFTVNALYKNIHSGDIEDPTGKGLRDIKLNVLMTPTNPEITFYDDPLRMLRAIRFYCQKGFVLDNKVWDAIKNNAYRLQGGGAIKAPISQERIRDEFTKIIMSTRASTGIAYLVQTDLLKYMFDNDTSVYDMFFYDQQNKHHNELLGTHCHRVLTHVAMYGISDLSLRLAALLHDIGKLTCFQIKDDGTKSYHGHEITSAEKAYELLRTLKYSNDICDDVKFMIENHMCLKQMNDGNGHLKITDKAFRKVCRRLGKYIDKCLCLMDADNLSHADEASNRLRYQITDFIKKMQDITKQEKELTPKLPVNGHDIMLKFNICPGPDVKMYLEKALDIFDENPSLTKDEILEKLSL